MATLDVNKYFNAINKRHLKEIAARLARHSEEIINGWIEKHSAFVEQPIPPSLPSILTTLYYGTLDSLLTSNIETYLTLELPAIARSIKNLGFSFESSVISVHFLESSYLPFLNEQVAEKSSNQSLMDDYIALDEFWHFWITELASAYFYDVKRSLSQELEEIRAFQEAIRPIVPNEIGRLQIGAYYVPSTEGAKLSGDIFDVMSINDALQYFLICDFSGHGIQAAAQAINIRAMFRGFARERLSPIDIMQRLNRVLFDELSEEEFATAILARLDQESGELKYVNAGHPKPLIGDSGNLRILDNEAHKEAAPLGVLKEAAFEEQSVLLNPGSTVCFYTDGVIEARKGDEFFGIKGVLNCLIRDSGQSVSGIAEGIWTECRSFAGDNISDDVAILILRLG